MQKKLLACKGCKTCFEVSDVSTLAEEGITEFIEELPGSKVYLIEEKKYPNVKLFLVTHDTEMDADEEKNFRYQLMATGDQLMNDVDKVLDCIKELKGQEVSVEEGVSTNAESIEIVVKG